MEQFIIAPNIEEILLEIAREKWKDFTQDLYKEEIKENLSDIIDFLVDQMLARMMYDNLIYVNPELKATLSHLDFANLLVESIRIRESYARKAYDKVLGELNV